VAIVAQFFKSVKNGQSQVMWEEHPEYQKNQAKLVGIVLLLILMLYTAFFIIERDWGYLIKFWLVVGGIVVGMGLTVGLVWLLVKIFTRK
jgi:hypothetical protein